MLRVLRQGGGEIVGHDVRPCRTSIKDEAVRASRDTAIDHDFSTLRVVAVGLDDQRIRVMAKPYGGDY